MSELTIKKVAEIIKTQAIEKQEILIGFDGFLDDIIAVVNKRLNVSEYTRINSISSYVERLSKLAGVSGNIEIDILQQKLGGNAPIMGNALIEQNLLVNAMVTIGKPHIHQVFEGFAKNCHQVYPIAEPGHTLAFEFHDGKIMMNQLAAFGEVSWENIVALVGKKEMQGILTNSKMIAMVNWTMLPFMNSIYEGIHQELKALGIKRKIFLDLADPMKRTAEDIQTMLDIVKKMGENNEVVLGLNKSEAVQIAKFFDIDSEVEEDLAQGIQKALFIEAVVLHATKFALAAYDGGLVRVEGPYTPEPKLTTGAGDNFNAGFCSGWLRNLNWEEALCMGVFTSGYYVRNAKSPKIVELADFMKSWKN